VLQYDVTSGVTDKHLVPRRAHFAAPNPFNPQTTIHFNLDGPGFVDVVIYDVNGRRVRELIRDAWMSAGWQRVGWDGKDEVGQKAASGVYLYRILANERRLVGKTVLLK
jgi:flagellar hook assembly protein FlgD